jgi:hypothetical protein
VISDGGTRGLDIKAGAAELKADGAARAEAEVVVERWAFGTRPRHAVVAHDQGRVACDRQGAKIKTPAPCRAL